MIKIFKNAESRAGYDRLYKDLVMVGNIFVTCESRLCSNALSGLMDSIYEEMSGLLTDEAEARIQKLVELDNDICSTDEGVAYLEWANSIPSSLVEAYEGYYETDMANDIAIPMEEPWQVENWIFAKIHSHTAEERLEIYLEWNGIIGYTAAITSIMEME